MSIVSFSEFSSRLDDASADIDAAEAHGCLSGGLCGQPVYPLAEWVAEILSDDCPDAVRAGIFELLESVHRETADSLAGDDLSFAPLLPADDGPLSERVGALASWCSGFLYALGRAGVLADASAEVNEVVQDFSEIARAGIGDEESDEEAEGDYAELVEFVRASVQLVYEDLAGRRALSATSSARTH